MDKSPFAKVLRDISFALEEKEILGLVGESGCGKSTLAKTIMQLYTPTQGEIVFEGRSLVGVSSNTLKEVRKKLQMVFQDPLSSLNPRMTVKETLREPFVIHKIYKNKLQETERIIELLELVGLQESYMQAFPHELSGGQRQRIGIARALALQPKLILCDEPIAALDVSIQAQMVNLLRHLHKKLQLTYLFISHDLMMVRHLCTQVAVMYLGTLVEKAPVEELYLHPKHPYTDALLSLIPRPLEKKPSIRVVIPGDIPHPSQALQGCVFASRCPKATTLCREKIPPLREISPKHYVRCHLY